MESVPVDNPKLDAVNDEFAVVVHIFDADSVEVVVGKCEIPWIKAKLVSGACVRRSYEVTGVVSKLTFAVAVLVTGVVKYPAEAIKYVSTRSGDRNIFV